MAVLGCASTCKAVPRPRCFGGRWLDLEQWEYHGRFHRSMATLVKHQRPSRVRAVLGSNILQRTCCIHSQADTMPTNQMAYRPLNTKPSTLADVSHVDTCLGMVLRQETAGCMRGEARNRFRVGHLGGASLGGGVAGHTVWPPGRSTQRQAP